MKHLKLADIIKIASDAYPDGLVEQYYKHPSGSHGDTLAKFIAIELRDTFDPSASEADQLVEAARVLDCAAHELAHVKRAFDATTVA